MLFTLCLVILGCIYFTILEEGDTNVKMSKYKKKI